MALCICDKNCNSVSDNFMHWILSDEHPPSQGIPLLSIRGAKFRINHIFFTLYGLVSFENINFEVTFVRLFLNRNQYEPEPFEETLTTIHSQNPTQKGITISQSHLRRIVYNTDSVVRNILITDCHFQRGLSPTFQDSQVTLVIDNCRMADSDSLIYAKGDSTVALVKYVDSYFTNSGVHKQHGGWVSFQFYNCTMEHINMRGLVLQGVFLVNMIHCHLTLSPDAGCEHGKGGCTVYITGTNQEPSNKFAMPLLSMFCQSKNWFDCNTVHLENSVFLGSLGLITRTSGAHNVAEAVKVQGINLTIIDCIFSLTSKINHGALVKFTGGLISGRNATFNAAKGSSSYFSYVDIRANSVSFSESIFQCPKLMNAIDITEEVGSIVHHQYSCGKQQYCEADRYSLEPGKMVLHGQSSLHHAAFLTSKHCKACPVGAQCGKHMQALPNYWGYKDQSNRVHMIRCPDGYCCESEETCVEIDSCNKHRGGILCGQCEGNWTASLFGSKCVPSENCPTALVLVLYIACIFSYGTGLIVISYCKEVGPSVAKRLFEKSKIILSLRTKQQGDVMVKTGDETKKNAVHKAASISEVQNVEEEKGDIMKYAQILFFYVQDAALFKVQLPDQGPQGDSLVVRILQFSPEVLTNIYTGINEFCFSSSSTAVTKIVFSSLFGHCVMFFLLLLCLCQKCLCSSTHKSQFRAKLLQTFLLVILLSYQKQVIGAFSLVHCVNIGSRTVLHLQADLECYSWWQTTLEVYIVLSILPVFFVLSHAPFHVEKKQMSVRMFIMACLFPIPVLLVYHLHKLAKRKTEIKSQFEEGEMDSLSGHTVSSLQHQTTHIESSIAWEEQVDDFLHRMTKADENGGVSGTALKDICPESESDTDIATENSSELSLAHKDQINAVESHPQLTTDTESGDVHKLPDCREVIVTALLKDYRTLTLFGFQFSWLGVHKLYRVCLVACSTYIAHPFLRLCCMSSVLLVMSTGNTVCKPYKQKAANNVSIMSFVASHIIALINMIRTGLVSFGCQFNCGFSTDVLWYLSKVETVLLVHVPVGAVALALGFLVVKKCREKKKEKSATA